MARDIEPVDAGTATVAGRLCNFPTGHTNLLPSHTQWLDQNVIPAVRNSPNPWIDVFGYASRIGNYQFNKQLSFQRCEAVVRYIKAAVPRVSFPQEFGYGSSRSTGGVNDDDGFWRAVEFFVYASGPPPAPRPKPLPPPEIIDEWYVTEFSGRTESVIVMSPFNGPTARSTGAPSVSLA